MIFHIGNDPNYGHYIKYFRRYNIFIKCDDDKIEFCSEGYAIFQMESVTTLIYENENKIPKNFKLTENLNFIG